MQKIILLISMALIAAISGAMSKYVLQEIPINSLLFLRFLTAFLTMLPLYHLLRWKSRQEMLRLIITSSGMGLSSIFYIYGIRTTNLGAAQAIFLTLPIIVLFLSYWLLHERIQEKKILGITISLCGAAIIFFLPKIYAGTGLNVGNIWWNIFIFLGALSYALYLVLMKTSWFSPMEFMYGGIIGATIMSSGLGVYDILTLDNPYSNLSLLGGTYIMMIGAIGTVGLYFLVQKLMKISDPLFVSLWNYIQLIFSSILGFFLFSEYIGLGFLIGSCLTMYGVYYISRANG